MATGIPFAVAALWCLLWSSAAERAAVAQSHGSEIRAVASAVGGQIVAVSHGYDVRWNGGWVRWCGGVLGVRTVGRWRGRRRYFDGWASAALLAEAGVTRTE